MFSRKEFDFVFPLYGAVLELSLQTAFSGGSLWRV